MVYDWTILVCRGVRISLWIALQLEGTGLDAGVGRTLEQGDWMVIYIEYKSIFNMWPRQIACSHQSFKFKQFISYALYFPKSQRKCVFFAYIIIVIFYSFQLGPVMKKRLNAFKAMSSVLFQYQIKERFEGHTERPRSRS